MHHRKRTMPPPSVEVERLTKDKGVGRAHMIKEMRIAEFHPHNETEHAEVHLIMSVEGIKDPLAVRFREPETLGFLIEELITYKKAVWPDSSMPFPLDEDVLEQVESVLAPREPTENSLETADDAPTV